MESYRILFIFSFVLFIVGLILIFRGDPLDWVGMVIWITGCFGLAVSFKLKARV